MSSCEMGSLVCIATCMCVYLACLLFADGLKNSHIVCPPCTCERDMRYEGLMVNCMGLRLKSLPVQLPVNTTTLLLSNNEVTNLTEQMFQRFPHLRALDLSHNSIVTIHENGFKGISKLKKLNLQFNQLVLDSQTYHPNVFKDLTELEELRIVDNVNNIDHPNATYPDQSFQHLTSLKVLYLDGLPTDFGPGFGQLRNLRNLTLSGYMKYCYLPVLQNTTFTNVPTVQHLNISNCDIIRTDLLTFQPMKHIQLIDISDNRHLGFNNATNATYGLQHSSLQILRANRIYPTWDVCSHLRVSHIKYLKQTHLRELHIDGNGIIGIGLNVVNYMPQSLERLFARWNKFQSGFISFMNPRMPIKFLDITGINVVQKPFIPLQRHFNSIPTPCPPKLKTIIASWCSLKGSIGHLQLIKSNIRKVIMKHNYFTGLEGPLVGSQKLEIFDLSHNVLQTIGNKVFEKDNSVEILNLSYNHLGVALRNDKRGDIFERLGKIRHLDLSGNSISCLPTRIFRGLRNVKTINLTDNYLTSFHAYLSKSMTKLDLGGNKIQMVPPHVLEQFDKLPTLLVNLGYNPISCTCEGLYFLRWLSENKHRVLGVEAMSCSMERYITNDSQITNLDVIIGILAKQCSAVNIVTISVSLSLLILLLGVIFVAICYRHRWKLRYLYHVGRRGYQVQHAVDNVPDDLFEYDVFVSYAAPDRRFVIDSMMQELETKAELRMCIHDRDFLPGEVIATNIVDTIQRSRKTLIVLSPSFLKSHWCEFEYNMAIMEGVHRRQNIVIVVLYEYVPIKDLPKDLAVMFRNNSYLEYSEEVFGNVVFWRNVVEAINTTRIAD
ncbi:toll-like receptor 4 [Haliotis rufescens]|uniref:toll-like receptor 4 n=1 Tax=Haliotis rufescens TaxID=6454 RepID=UPI001EAFD398|nr:toll-like receptor 4 [Haliotis rufescens]